MDGLPLNIPAPSQTPSSNSSSEAPSPRARDEAGYAAIDALTRSPHDGAYHCPACDSPFTRRSNLRRHYAIHSRSTGSQCAFCARAFTRSDQLRAHLLRCLHPLNPDALPPTQALGGGYPSASSASPTSSTSHLSLGGPMPSSLTHGPFAQYHYESYDSVMGGSQPVIGTYTAGHANPKASTISDIVPSFLALGSSSQYPSYSTVSSVDAPNGYAVYTPQGPAPPPTSSFTGGPVFHSSPASSDFPLFDAPSSTNSGSTNSTLDSQRTYTAHSHTGVRGPRGPPTHSNSLPLPALPTHPAHYAHPMPAAPPSAYGQPHNALALANMPGHGPAPVVHGVHRQARAQSFGTYSYSPSGAGMPMIQEGISHSAGLENDAQHGRRPSDAVQYTGYGSGGYFDSPPFGSESGSGWG